MFQRIKGFILKLNLDELIFDISFALLITIFQIFFFNSGRFIVKLFHPTVIVIFSLFVQFILSFKLGSLNTRYQAYSKKWINRLIGTFSFLFIFPMLFFVGAAYVFNNGLADKYAWLMFAGLINIIAGYIIGQNFEEKSVKNTSQTNKRKNIALMFFTAISLAFLNIGVYGMISNIPSDHSISEAIAFFALMIISGFLPFRIMMMFAPPLNRTNMIIGLFVICYDFILLYFGN